MEVGKPTAFSKFLSQPFKLRHNLIRSVPSLLSSQPQNPFSKRLAARTNSIEKHYFWDELRVLSSLKSERRRNAAKRETSGSKKVNELWHRKFNFLCDHAKLKWRPVGNESRQVHLCSYQEVVCCANFSNLETKTRKKLQDNFWIN